MAIMWCMQCNKLVSENKLVWLTLPTGRKRRMCENCKQAALDRSKIRNIKESFNNKGV